MKLINTLLTALLTVCLYGSPQNTDFSQKGKPATIKLLIQKNGKDALIEVKGRYHVYEPISGTQLSTGIMSTRHLATQEEYGLKWGEKFPGTNQIRIVPGDSQTTILVNGIEYRGCVELYAIEGKLNIVNEVDVENFLKSTLTLQFPEPLADEVMNAVTIVARTHAYYLAAKGKNAFWHADAHEMNYQGSALTAHKIHVDRAVDLTRHAIMTFQNTPFAATWTKDSAGRTADFAAIFRKAITSPPGVTAPLAAKERERHKWSFTTSKHALAKAANLPSISSVDLYLAHNSDKVYAVKLSSGTQSNDIDFFTLQKVLGSHQLRSTDFTVSVKGDELVFTGYGEGPGTGLCLFSAQALAEKGEKASSILSAFFPTTQIEKIRSLE
jgi:stage II sporulation protein D